MKTAYILKMFPRFSQTFVLNEILAHEEADWPLEIVSLRLPDDVRFHESVARVTSKVHRVPKPSGKAATLLKQMHETEAALPGSLRVVAENPKVIASDMEQALALALLVHRRGITHMHAHFGTVGTTTARLAAQMAGISYSFTAHAKDIFHQAVDADVLRSKLCDAARVVTVSKYNVDYLSRHYPEATNRLVHIDNGLPLDEFPYQDPIDRRPLIFAVGRLVEKKGFEYLLRACAVLRDEGLDFRCEVAGGGTLMASLRTLVGELELDNHLALIGPQPQGVIRRKLHKAAVLAAPCIVAEDQDRDGLPTILLEAMAMGTPCVSTDVTGIPEVLDHDVTGLAVGQRDVESLALACRKMIKDPALRSRLARNARSQIESRFDIRKNAARIRDMVVDIRNGTVTTP